MCIQASKETGPAFATAATDFQKGSCSSIKAGRDVQVEGVELVDGTIRADVVIKQ